MIFMAVLLLSQQAQLGPPEALQRSFETRSAWRTCVAVHANYYAGTDEAADLILAGAFGKCSGPEAEFKRAFQQLTIDGTHGSMPEYVDKAVESARREIREQAVAAILEARLEAKKARSRSGTRN